MTQHPVAQHPAAQLPFAVRAAPDERSNRIPEGTHEVTVIRADLKQHTNKFGDPYTALHLTVTDDEGRTASGMAAEYKGGVVAALSAIGQAVLTLRDLTPARLMALRGQRIRAAVQHRAYRNAVYANVVSINGRTL